VLRSAHRLQPSPAASTTPTLPLCGSTQVTSPSPAAAPAPHPDLAAPPTPMHPDHLQA
jgi:hypothetical protein